MGDAKCEKCGKTIGGHFGMRCQSESDDSIWTSPTTKVRPRKLYDVKCWELAVHFLSEDAPNTGELAAYIQDAVEDFLYQGETK